MQSYEKNIITMILFKAKISAFSVLALGLLGLLGYIPLRILHIMSPETLGLTLTRFLYKLGGHTAPYLMSTHFGVLQHKSSGSHNGALTYLAVVEQRGTHADKGTRVYGAGMHGGVVPYRHIVTYIYGTCRVGHVHAGTVLHVDAIAYSDGCYIATYNGVKPHRTLVA